MTKDQRFKAALDLLLAVEQGFVDDKRDPGGATKLGVSLRFLRSLGEVGDIDKDGDVDTDDIRALDRETAATIYRNEFWRRLRCHEMPVPVAVTVFDCGVNQGVGTAARILQRSARATADGIIGPKTLASVQDAPVMDLLLEIGARRGLRYARTKNFDVFGLGWMRRLMLVTATVLKMEDA